MFLEELNELFGENWSKFLTAGYLVFWKQFPAAWYLDTSMALMHSFLRQYRWDMDPVETVMYGPSTSNQVCVLFYVMQCVSRTKVPEF